MKCGLCYAVKNKTPNRIYELRSGVAFVSFDQKYEGWCVLAFKKHVQDMRELSKEDYKDFWDDVKILANAIEKAFSCDKINYAVLMNVSPHLHCHIIPRYKSDPDWGKDLWPRGKLIKEDKKAQLSIAEKIRKFL